MLCNAIGTDGQRIKQGANISLPLSLFQTINGITNVGVFYGIYNSSTLFPVAALQENDTNADRQTQVVSNVVAVTVGQVDMTFENLPQPVTIVLGLQKEKGMVSKMISRNHCSVPDKCPLLGKRPCIVACFKGSI